MPQPSRSFAAFAESHTVPYLAQFVVVTASSFVIAGVLFGKFPLPFQSQVAHSPLRCTQPVQSGQSLSREQLTTLRNLDGQQTRADIRGMLDTPYCEAVITSNATSERLLGDAYPLEFDPQIWLVVLYSGEAYVGYQFEFQ